MRLADNVSHSNKKVAVIGAGAAGFFTAINLARLNPNMSVTIYEKNKDILSKVRVSGGGRCNVTHNCFDPEQLASYYPRGGKMLRWSFEQFQAKDTVNWFKERGVQLKAEDDGRMFPVTDSSETIIDCLKKEAEKFNVSICTRVNIKKIEPLKKEGFRLHIHKGNSLKVDFVVVATGGFSREKSYNWLKELGHTILPPVPSLFTFNFRDKIFADLAGISVPQAEVSINNSPYKEVGPTLITHWGFSGPAVLKISAWAARYLYEQEYRYGVSVNWLYPMNQEDVRNTLLDMREHSSKKKVTKQDQFTFPNRLWIRFLELSKVNTEKRWADVSNKEIHAITLNLVQGTYDIQGKTTYKEEFVTCGGVSLKEVNPNTLESKKIAGLYFVGEVLDIDGVTGGFNFQAAWTNGWLASIALSQK